MRKHRHTSRVARRRRVTSIPGGLSGTEKAVRWARGPGKWGVLANGCALLLSLGWCSDPIPHPSVPGELEDQ